MIAERFAPEKLLELGSALLFISFHMGVSENEGYLILGSFKGSLIKGIYKGSMKGLGFGVSEKLGVPYFGVLIIRILLFRVSILGSPIFGNPHMGGGGCGVQGLGV